MNDTTKGGTPPPADHGEKPDLGRKPDHLAETLEEALTGSNLGSDTRAGSLRGGSASGSDIDPDQEAIDRGLTRQGEQAQAAGAGADGQAEDSDAAGAVRNTGRRGGPGDEADAATG